MVASLSRGQKARLGLLVALAHRPDLLVLDEPSSGLDPVVRRDILDAILRTIADEGRTVLFSSHLLGEVERVADHITMIDQGRIALSAPLEAIRGAHRCVTLCFKEPQSQPPAFAGALCWDGGRRDWTTVLRGDVEELRARLDQWGASIVAAAGQKLIHLVACVWDHPIQWRKRLGKPQGEARTRGGGRPGPQGVFVIGQEQGAFTGFVRSALPRGNRTIFPRWPRQCSIRWPLPQQPGGSAHHRRVVHA